MSYDSTNQKYTEYPRSSFPKKVCDLPNKSDVTASLASAAASWESAVANGNFSLAQSILEQNPGLKNTQVLSSDWNTLLDEIKSTQQFFTDKVTEYLLEATQKTIGLNDTVSTDEGKKTVAYSAYKSEYMSGKYLDVTFQITTSNWISYTGDEKSIYPYSYTYTNSAILADDEVYVIFSPTSQFYAGKANIVIKENTGNGNITFLARKKPTATLTVSNIRIKRG